MADPKDVMAGGVKVQLRCNEKGMVEVARAIESDEEDVHHEQIVMPKQI